MSASLSRTMGDMKAGPYDKLVGQCFKPGELEFLLRDREFLARRSDLRSLDQLDGLLAFAQHLLDAKDGVVVPESKMRHPAFQQALGALRRSDIGR